MDTDPRHRTSFADDNPPRGCRGMLIGLLITTAGLTIAACLLAVARVR